MRKFRVFLLQDRPQSAANAHAGIRYYGLDLKPPGRAFTIALQARKARLITSCVLLNIANQFTNCREEDIGVGIASSSYEALLQAIRDAFSARDTDFMEFHKLL